MLCWHMMVSSNFDTHSIIKRNPIHIFCIYSFSFNSYRIFFIRRQQHISYFDIFCFFISSIKQSYFFLFKNTFTSTPRRHDSIKPSHIHECSSLSSFRRELITEEVIKQSLHIDETFSSHSVYVLVISREHEFFSLCEFQLSKILLREFIDFFIRDKSTDTHFIYFFFFATSLVSHIMV